MDAEVNEKHEMTEVEKRLMALMKESLENGETLTYVLYEVASVPSSYFPDDSDAATIATLHWLLDRYLVLKRQMEKATALIPHRVLDAPAVLLRFGGNPPVVDTETCLHPSVNYSDPLLRGGELVVRCNACGKGIAIPLTAPQSMTATQLSAAIASVLGQDVATRCARYWAESPRSRMSDKRSVMNRKMICDL